VLRKALHITFALNLALCLLWIGITPLHHAQAESCGMKWEVSSLHHVTRINAAAEPWKACWGGKTASCQVSECCAWELPDFALFPLPTVGSRIPSHITTASHMVFPPLGFSRGLTNKSWALALSPPIPIFLMNVSLLC